MAKKCFSLLPVGHAIEAFFLARDILCFGVVVLVEGEVDRQVELHRDGLPSLAARLPTRHVLDCLDGGGAATSTDVTQNLGITDAAVAFHDKSDIDLAGDVAVTSLSWIADIAAEVCIEGVNATGKFGVDCEWMEDHRLVVGVDAVVLGDGKKANKQHDRRYQESFRYHCRLFGMQRYELYEEWQK